MTKSLAGKQAIVTGAAGRIGRAVTEELIHQGAEVLGLDHNEDWLQQMVSDRFTWCQVDLLDEQGYETVAAAVDKLSKVDILVNCMGGIYRAPFLEHDPKEFTRLWMLNVYSVFRVSQLVARKMAQNQSGKIINFAAVGAVRPSINHSGYCAAKGSLVAFSRSLALELAKYNIQVNVIAPGPTETVPPTSPYYADHPEIYQSVLQNTPLGRLGTPEDHMGLVTYLASERSNWVTGQVVMSDGGMELA